MPVLFQNGAVETLSLRRKNWGISNQGFSGAASQITAIESHKAERDHSATPLSGLSPPLQLLDLPSELLTHTFQYLNSSPPSTQKRLSKPEHDLTASAERPLKEISLANRRLRFLVLPLLFRNARLDPYQLNAFLDFTTASDLTRHISTLTACLQGPCSHIHPAWWSRLISDLPNLTTMTVLAAPHIFAEIGQVPIETCHVWAFKMQYHSMTLKLTPAGLSSNSPASTPSLDNDIDPTAQFTGNQNLLTTRAWTSFDVNESSHLPAYSTYEYFLKVPPSLLYSLYRRQHLLTTSQPHDLQQPSLSAASSQFLTNLRSFSYTAIFPFYNHVDEILKCVRQMKRLKRLFIKLCPEPESTELQDELERNAYGAGRTEGRIDVNDPWNEFDTSYMLIPHTIIYLTTDGELERFQTDDVKMVGIRDTLIEDINRRLEGLGCWKHVGDGVWQRHMSVAVSSSTSVQGSGGDSS